jgi:hypothetical protein
MVKLFSLAEVTAMYSGPYGSNKNEFNKVYSRIKGALYDGACRPTRLGRGWAFTRQDVEKLQVYLFNRWAMRMRPEMRPDAEATSKAAV